MTTALTFRASWPSLCAVPPPRIARSARDRNEAGVSREEQAIEMDAINGAMAISSNELKFFEENGHG